MSYVIGTFDAAVSEIRGDALVARSSELCRSLVVGEENEGSFAVHIQCPLQSGKQRQEGLSEAGDDSGLVGNEVTTASEEKLQLGDLLLTWVELAEVWPHPGLVSDEVGISGIGFGLTAVGVAGSIHAEAGDVEDFLIVFP